MYSSTSLGTLSTLLYPEKSVIDTFSEREGGAFHCVVA